MPKTMLAQSAKAYHKTKGNNIYNKDKIEPQHIYYNFHVSEWDVFESTST